MGLAQAFSAMRVFITDSRFRADVRAFQKSRAFYVFYAWKLMGEAGVSEMLGKGASLKEVIAKKKIKNERMLEGVLDLLVGEGVLRFERGKYWLAREPRAPNRRDYDYLVRYYPSSVKWGELMRSHAAECLVNGKVLKGADFKRAAGLWDEIMGEMPRSFRLYAVRLMMKDLRPGAHVLDAGCGSGVAIEDMLKENKDVFITGVDSSVEMLERARKRISKAGVSRRVRFIKADFLKSRIPGKYDAVFCSLVLNHIKPEDRITFYGKMKSLLKKDGKLVVYQIVHQSKFDRNFIWVMYLVPSHTEYPFKQEYVGGLKTVFKNVEQHLKGNVIEARK